MLKVDNYEITDTQIQLLVYEENSNPDSESAEMEISLDDFEQWCIDKYGSSNGTKSMPFTIFDMTGWETGSTFNEWWDDSKEKTYFLETYINRPTMPIIGGTDNEIY